MLEADLPNLGGTSELFGELGDSIEKISQSSLVMQAQITEKVGDLSAMQDIANSFGDHISNLRASVINIFNSDFSAEEKLKITTGILFDDTNNRVNFFKELSEEDGSEDNDAPDFNKTVQVISQKYKEVLEANGTDTDFIDNLMKNYLIMMQADFTSFMKTDFYLEKAAHYASKQKTFEKLNRFGLSAAGAAVGGLLAAITWQKIKKYF